MCDFCFCSETNLKCRQCLVEVAELAHEVVDFDGFIRCETPNNLLNKFHGVLLWNKKEYVLSYITLNLNKFAYLISSKQCCVLLILHNIMHFPLKFNETIILIIWFFLD